MIGSPASSSSASATCPVTRSSDTVRLSTVRERCSLSRYRDGEDLLFPTGNGKPLRNQNWRRSVLTPSLAAAKIKPITPHNLRDTAASLAIDAGASVVAVARMLGHEDAATTLRHYASLFPDDLGDVAKRMNAKARTARDGRSQRPKAA